VNGFGLDSPYVVASGASDLKQYSDVFALDVEQDGFVIDYNVQGTRGWAGYFKISDLDFGSGIAAVSIDTNAVNWDLSNMLVFDSSSVTLRWMGISFDSDTYFNVTLSDSPSEVPIPAAAFMFAPALLGFLGLRRKSKLAQA
jgi:hypothetical protein